MLQESSGALWDHYDLAILDLDGVVYIGSAAVPGAPERLEKAAAAGMHLAFVTNNASRPPSVVASHLRELGVPARDEDVVTSAQAAARLLAERLAPGSRVYVIGGQGLFDALAERGLVVVQDIDDEPHAVVSGYHPDLRWKTVSDGAILVRRGLPWVASNMDVSVPTEHGPGPGNGVLVGAVARFAGVEPVVAGKPRRPLFDETVRRVGGDRPLVVGDRLDTDIEGAHSSGLDSLLVLTGVTGLDELVAAGERQRPTYLSSDLSGLGAAHPLPERTSDGWELDGWRAVVEDGELLVSGSGAVDDWWRVAVVAAWDHLDTTGDVVGTAKASAPGSVAADERDPAEG